MENASRQFIAKSQLTSDQIALAERIIAATAVKGILVGALIDNRQNVFPLLLANKRLNLLRYTDDLTAERSHVLSFLKQTYENLHLTGVTDPNLQFGEIENRFWVLRKFYETNLNTYLLTNTNLEIEKINQFLMKTVHLLLRLERFKLAHGHLVLNNLMLSGEQLTIVDFGLGFSSSDESKDLAPEAKRRVRPLPKTDIYCLGLIIKEFYRGKKMPLPYDLPDRMLNEDIDARPSLSEVQDALKELVPKTPEPIVEKLKATPAEEVLDSVELSSQVVEQIKDAMQSERKQSAQNALLLITVVVVLVLIYFNIDNTKLFQVREEMNIATASPEVEPEPSESPKLAAMILKQLEQDKISGKKIEEIVIKLSEDGYSLDLLKQFFATSDKTVSLVKALILLYSEDLVLLDKIFDDFQFVSQLQKYYDWFKLNPLVDWSQVTNAEKLLLIAERLPDTFQQKEYYYDLLRFSNKQIRAKSLNKIVSLFPYNIEFLKLLAASEEIKRRQVVSLLFALSVDGKKQISLVNQWFNFEPPVDLVFELTLAAKPNAEGKDYFSLAAAKYIQSKKDTYSLDDLKFLLTHHEDQLRSLAVSLINKYYPKRTDLIKQALETETNPKIKEAMKLVLGQ